MPKTIICVVTGFFVCSYNMGTDTSSESYAVGTPVFSRYDGNSKTYYPAKIIRKHPYDRYNVKFKSTNRILTVFADDIMNAYDDNGDQSKEPALSPSFKAATPQKESTYKGIISLFNERRKRNQMKKDKNIKEPEAPMFNIKYSVLIQQLFIILCITVLIMLRDQTETFFRIHKHSFQGIFDSDDYTQSNLMQIDVLSEHITDKITTYFNLLMYTDNFMYPSFVIMDNIYDNTSDYIPTAKLEFLPFDASDDVVLSYTLNEYNYTDIFDDIYVISDWIQQSNFINLHFEIDSFSFNHDTRNLWRWHLLYSYETEDTSTRIIPQLDITYERVSTDISWWDDESSEYTWFIVASIGLSSVSLVALIRFLCQHGLFSLCSIQSIKKLKYLNLLPLSHLLSFVCGIVYMLNLSQIYDLNDEWEFRFFLAITVLSSWCMLSVAINVDAVVGTQYAALFKTIEISFVPIVNATVPLLPIVCGFILCGSFLFGIPNHGPEGEQLFSSPEITAVTLYSMVLGDAVAVVFERAGIHGNYKIFVTHSYRNLYRTFDPQKTFLGFF